MERKNTGLFKGLLTVLILSAVVFLVLFFFFPNISLKYFGTAADSDKAVEETFAALLYKANYMTEEERQKVSGYINSEEGRRFLRGLSEAVRSGSAGIAEFSSSEEFASFRDRMYSILSPSSFSRLTDRIEKTASGLLDIFDKD